MDRGRFAPAVHSGEPFVRRFWELEEFK